MPRFQTSDGLSLHYSDTGPDTPGATSPPLLCLAGLTSDGRDFDFLLPHLGQTRVIRLDCRGRGQSDWGAPNSYTVLTEARDVLELLDHLSLAQVAILGTSRGGLIAMTLAATAKARLCGVALNDVGPELGRSGLEHIATRIGKKPAFKTHQALLKVWPDLAQGFENVPESRFREEITRLYAQGDTGLELRYDPALALGVQAALEADELPDLWPLFDSLDGLPLLALRGANSNLLSAETFVQMQARQPQMIAATIADRGHAPYLDEPDALAALQSWRDLL